MTTRGRWPWGLVGMLALLAVIESSLARREWSEDAVAEDWRTAGDPASVREAARCEILALGDSQVKAGLQPRIIEPRLGRSTFNLAVVGGHAPSTYFLFRRVLEAGGRPRALVVDFFPGLLMADITHKSPTWPRYLSLPEFRELCRDVRSRAWVLDAMVRRWLPSYGHREGIRVSILAATAGAADGSLSRAEAHRRNLRLNRGAIVQPDGVAFEDHPGRHLAASRVREWRCHPLNAIYLRKILRLARVRGIPVFWVIPPNSPGYQAVEDELGRSERYTQVVRWFCQGEPNLTLIDGRRSEYPRSVFWDATHVSRSGAVCLSLDVAEVVDRALSGRDPRPRWYELPAFRPRGRGRDLEDLHQSTLALAAGDSRR